MNASEEDKIKAMMHQSTKDFDSSKYVCRCLCVRYIQYPLHKIIASAFCNSCFDGSFVVALFGVSQGQLLDRDVQLLTQ